jgi:hypothetical protein
MTTRSFEAITLSFLAVASLITLATTLPRESAGDSDPMVHDLSSDRTVRVELVVDLLGEREVRVDTSFPLTEDLARD